MPQSQTGIYTLRDPDSGDTFQVHLDHTPDYAESLQLIADRRTAASRAQTKAEFQQNPIGEVKPPDTWLGRSIEFAKGYPEAIPEFGKELYQGAKQNVLHPFAQPQGEKIPVKMPNGQTLTAINPYAGMDALYPGQNRDIEAQKLIDQNKLREAGKQYGLGTLEEILFALPLLKGARPSQATPEVLPPNRQMGTGVTVNRPQLNPATGEPFIEAEVVPSTESGALAKRGPTVQPPKALPEFSPIEQPGRITPQVQLPGARSIQVGPSSEELNINRMQSETPIETSPSLEPSEQGITSQVETKTPSSFKNAYNKFQTSHIKSSIRGGATEIKENANTLQRELEDILPIEKSEVTHKTPEVVSNPTEQPEFKSKTLSNPEVRQRILAKFGIKSQSPKEDSSIQSQPELSNEEPSAVNIDVQSNQIENSLNPIDKNNVGHWMGSSPYQLERDIESQQRIYNAYQPIRDQLQKQYGDTIDLYRTQPKDLTGKEPRNLLSFVQKDKLNSIELNKGDEVIHKKVPINDVVAVITRPDTGYKEFIIKNQPSEEAKTVEQPNPEDMAIEKWASENPTKSPLMTRPQILDAIKQEAAKGEPPAGSVTTTADTIGKLRELGYTPQDIARMSPEQQQFITQKGTTKLPPAKAQGAEELSGIVHRTETGATAKTRLQRIKETLKEIAGNEEGFIDFKKLYELLKPEPGQEPAPSKLATQVMSPSRNLEANPATKEFTQTSQRQILKANAFANTEINKFHNMIKGLSDSELNQIAKFRLGIGKEVLSPRASRVNNQLNKLLDTYRLGSNELYRASNTPYEERLTRPKQIGYKGPNYLPEVKHESPEEKIANYINSRNVFTREESKRKTNIPISPSMMRREGTIPREQLETDLKKLVYKYLVDTAPTAARAGMVQVGNAMQRGMTEGMTRSNMANFIEQLSRHDDVFRAANAVNRLFEDLTRASTRAILFANPRVQLLHAASLITQVAPDVGIKAAANSIVKFSNDPIKYLKMVQKFQPPNRNWHTGLGAKADAISQLGNIGFRTAEAMAFPAYYDLALKDGFTGANAEAEAMRRVFRAFGVPQRGDEPAFLKQVGSFPGAGPTATRFTRIPLNLVQNYVKGLTSGDMWKIARYVSLGLAAYELDKKHRIPIFHLSWGNFLFSSQQTSRTVLNLFSALGSGDMQKAKKQVLNLFYPASIRGYEREGIKGTLLEYERPPKHGRSHMLFVKPETPRVLPPSSLRIH